MKTLNDLEPGETGLITHIKSSEQINSRLMDHGLFEGARVEMLCCAPLGDPILVRVLGAVIALRRDEAQTIEISGTGGEGSAGGKRNRHSFGWKPKQRENQPL
ncbi:MAG: FeoA family protein [Candidatus Latescibacterota bacterium]